jgi:hypothetical protein
MDFSFGSITNSDAGGCSLGALDCIFDARATRERDAHPTILEGRRLGENPQVDGKAGRAKRQRLGYALIGNNLAFLLRQNDRRGGRSDQLDRRDRKLTARR